MKKTCQGAIPYDHSMADLYHENPDLAMEVLNACMEEGDMEMLLVTLRQITKDFGGMSQVAQRAGLNEHSLYRALSRCGNPRLKTLVNLADAMGMRMTFVPKTLQPGQSR